MSFRIKHIATSFALLLALAAFLPLVAYGVISILSLQRGTHASVIAGNVNVATRAATELGRYVTTNAELLKALAADLQDTDLDRTQQDRILKNYILQVREFRELTLFDEAGSPIVSSRIGRPHVQIPRTIAAMLAGVAMSPMRIDEDLLPTATFAIHLKQLNHPAGWLVGEFSLEEMWRMVDQIRIGDHGFAMVVAPDGALIAHGDPDKKALVAQARNMSDNALVQAVHGRTQQLPPSPAAGEEAAVPQDASSLSVSQEYIDQDGRWQLGVSAPIVPLGWTVIVEQPTGEAYAAASRLQRQLAVAIVLGLGIMISVGFFFGQSFIKPILALKRGTQAIARGELDTRVVIDRSDEFADLGQAFNAMGKRLIELQEEVKRQERQAMFGRVAAGIVHDLSHPIQNIGNSARLLIRDDSDTELREVSRRTIERELTTLKHFMEDLRNVIKPQPIQRVPIDVNPVIAEVVEATRPQGQQGGVTVEARLAPGKLVIDGDRFAIGRVFRNLITNAVQATGQGGQVTIATARNGNHVRITVSDTGSGIPPERLATIFEDYVTTKRRGLGLGLAISRRIVEQLNGSIDVQSTVGHGTTFTVQFPAGSGESAQAAS